MKWVNRFWGADCRLLLFIHIIQVYKLNVYKGGVLRDSRDENGEHQHLVVFFQGTRFLRLRVRAQSCRVANKTICVSREARCQLNDEPSEDVWADYYGGPWLIGPNIVSKNG